MQFIKRYKKQLTLALKLLAFALAIYVIKKKLFDDRSFDNFFNNPDFFSFRNIKFLCVLFVLMGLNWIIEAIKWKYLVFQVERLTIKSSIVAILKGSYLSLITPNRIGEGLGKVEGMKKKARPRGSFAFFVGSAAQLLVTSIMGCFALWMSEKTMFIVKMCGY